MIWISQAAWGVGSFMLDIPHLHIKTGITLLVGPNGAGKSSFMRILSTAVHASEGEILYAGHSVRDSLPLIRRNIGFLPSGLELYEEMTPRKLLRYMAEMKGLAVKQAAIEELLEEFGLDPLKNRPIRHLSQGRKQCLGIAQAMLGRPPFVLLDEPLNYLDSLEQKRVLHVLSGHAAGAAIIVITHEMNEWEPYTGRILHLDGGRIVEDMSPREWKTGLPAGVYEGNIPEGELAHLDPERILRLSVEGGNAKVRIIGRSKPVNHWFRPAEPTLEDAYFARRLGLQERENSKSQ